ncbi:hypothetical protein DFH11DRAFT_1572296 [Phellopilus nigrolimitatus]|nr:hypothetical protein DFH11DRAFT_1572296 [Phellopilus nigrolimitatus]
MLNEPKAILDALESCNIKTDEDLLFTSSLALFQRCPPDSVTFSDLERIREQVLKATATEGISGLELLNDLVSKDENTSPPWASGHSELDSLLRTVKEGVVEVAGGKGSAKTTLVMNIVLAHLTSSESCNVHWIDTIGDFSAVRASQILNASTWAQNMPNAHNLINTALERLHVSLAFTAEVAHNILMSIRSTTQVMVFRPLPIFHVHRR